MAAPVYKRSAQADIARALASARTECYCEPQLRILDRIISMLMDDFHEHDPTFNVESWARLARHHEGRLQSRHRRHDKPTSREE